MQDETRYGAPALSIEDARALAACVAAVVNERDRLREEVKHCREVISELAALRKLIADNPEFTAVATANGHLHSVRDQVDDAGDTAPALGREPTPETSAVVMDADETTHGRPAADRHSEQASGERHTGEALTADAAQDDSEPPLHTSLHTGETPGDDPAAPHNPEDRPRTDDTAPPRDSVDDDHGEAPEPDPEPPAEHTELVTRPDTGESSTGETTPDDSPQQVNDTVPDDDARAQADDDREQDAAVSQIGEARPSEGTLLGRILNAIESSSKPRRTWQLQKQLNLPRAPSPELSRLVQQGHILRLGEALYGIPGRRYDRPKV